MDTLFDLPAHALLIHAPIVLLPLAAVATIVLAARPGWRRSAGWWMVGGLSVVALLVYLAKSSGEQLDDAFAGAVDVSTHEQLADTTFVLTLVWLAAYTALVAVDRRTGQPEAGRSAERPAAALSDQPVAVLLLSAASVALAVLASVWLVRTGHEGSRVVWEPTMDFLEF
jgi:preprotein translocase subunit SecG